MTNQFPLQAKRQSREAVVPIRQKNHEEDLEKGAVSGKNK